MLTGGAGGRAMTGAFEELFGIPNGFGGVPMPGRTDLWLLRHALAAHAIPSDDPRVSRFRDTYLRLLARELEQPPSTRKGVLPGVRQLLDALQERGESYLGLLTGNYEPAARLKLEHFDLWRYFRSGAFGDHSVDRNDLFAAAIARIEVSGGLSVRAEQTVVIGDTPHDVAVAKAAGARSIAVATGSHTVDELHATHADFVFENLSDLAAVLRALT